jgi:IMP dehydrogenase
MGSLRTSMATCGYEDIASFHRAEVMVAPALQTEGKHLQRDQAVGMGATRAAAAAPVPEVVADNGGGVVDTAAEPVLVGGSNGSGGE